jgi:ATP-dependent DNA helicase RecG
MPTARHTRPAPDDTLLKVRKILELERNKKFQDNAVMGGLDRFLAMLLESNGAAKNAPLAGTIRSLPDNGYKSLSPNDRRLWIDTALATLSGGAPRTPPATPRPRAAHIEVPKGLDAPITVLKGVKGATAAKFEKLGVTTVRDLLYYFPRRHNDFASLRPISDLTPGEEQTVRAQVWSAEETRLGRRSGTIATIGDASGTMRVVWFNLPWLAKQLKTNSEIVVSGRVSLYQSRPTFENPEWEPYEPDEQSTHTGRLVPVYSTTEGMRSSRTIRKPVRQALDEYVDLLGDPLPAELRARLGLIDLSDAVRQAHFPDDFDKLDAARRRLALDELLPLQLSVLIRRQQWQQPGSANPLALPKETLDAFLASLPFELTGAQQNALAQLLADLARDIPMSRLLQGDVGSGKTVVAAAGLVAAAANGQQSAFMAPTEILAEQHFRTLCSLFGADTSNGSVAEATPPYLDRPLRIALLTGSLNAKAKSELYERIEAGEVDIAVGTHALIQGGVTFARLGFVIVDEQHRFGVMQRAALRDKSARSSHMLVMTATPIPRSLYLTLYGDLDASAIDELPPGRKPVVTRWWPPERREDAYDFLREQVESGRQAFVICPLVEESESSQSKAAVQEYERLREQVYPDFTLELVHGRMSGKEKDAAMQRFRSGEAQVLVSTSVIEVGIDVPNATVMLIEGADRFGLAQLHQFRGRVGRGADQSYCLLLSESPSAEAQQRLRLMQETTDGFALAEADLRMRGPGEFFGKRQSGLPDFHVASLFDTRLIELARKEAERLLRNDPGLSRPEHAALAVEVARMMEVVTGELH